MNENPKKKLTTKNSEKLKRPLNFYHLIKVQGLECNDKFHTL